MSCLAVLTRETSSASHVERLTNGCLLEHHEIGPPLNSMTCPLGKERDCMDDVESDSDGTIE